MSAENVESVEYNNLKCLLKDNDTVNALLSLELEKERPKQLENIRLMADFRDMSIKTFDEQYKIKTGNTGVMYIMNSDSTDSELCFLLQGIIGGCLLVGPHIISRMKNRLSVLQYRVDLVGAGTENFQKSIRGYERLHQIMESHCRYRTLQPLKRSFIGEDVEAIVSCTPLLDLIHLSDSSKTEVPANLDPNGYVNRFVNRKTHVFTEDNMVDIVETVHSANGSIEGIRNVEPESIRVGQLVEVVVSLRAFPAKNGCKSVGLHLNAIRLVSRSTAVRLAEIVNAAKILSEDKEETDGFVLKRKVHFVEDVIGPKKAKKANLSDGTSGPPGFHFEGNQHALHSAANAKMTELQVTDLYNEDRSSTDADELFLVNKLSRLYTKDLPAETRNSI